MARGVSEHFQAVVIGGGPAGSVAALTLARLGWRVAVIERRQPGRAKACGHCLHPRGVRVLERLGLARAVLGEGPAAAPAATRRLRVHLGGGRRAIEIALDRGARPGAVVDRAVFDDRLLGAAAETGVEVIRPATASVAGLGTVEVVSRETNRGAPRLLGAGLVVGADGLGSRVARRGGHTVAGRKAGFALELPAGAAGGPEPGVIEMVVLRAGYVGAVRSAEGRLHVAGLIDLTHVRQARPADLLGAASSILGVDEIGAACAAWGRWRPLGAAPMPWRPAAVSIAGMALVGDAAGYVEPFTGEGMGWALESAELLGACAGGAGRRPGCWDGSAAAAYRKCWSRAIGTRHRTCRLVAAVVGRPGVMAAMPGLLRTGLAGWLAGRVMAA